MTRWLRVVIAAIFGGVMLVTLAGCELTERIAERLGPVATDAAEDARGIVLDEVIDALEELRD